MAKIPPEDLTHHPRFRQLLGRRLRWSFGLGLYVLLVFSIYVSGMAWAPNIMAIPVGVGWAVNVGLVVASFVVINGLIAAGVYAWWANTRLDPLKKALIAELSVKSGDAE